MSKIKLQSTYYPKNTTDINQWYKEYRISSRCPKYTREETGVHINDLYDHSKLFNRTDKFSFSRLLKSLKLIDL